MSKNVVLTLGIISFLLAGIPYFGFIFALIVLILTVLSIKKEKASQKTAALILSIIAFVGGIFATTFIVIATNSVKDMVQNEVVKQEKQNQGTKTYALNDVIKIKKVETSITGVEKQEMGNSDDSVYVSISYTFTNTSDKLIDSSSTPTIIVIDEKGKTYPASMSATFDLEANSSVSGSQLVELPKSLYKNKNWFVVVDGNQKVSVK